MSANMPRPKFTIGDTIMMKDDFHFNPSERTISVGKIEAIHFHRIDKRLNTAAGRSIKFSHKISYSVSGFSIRPNEDNIQLYEGGIPYER